MTKEELIFKLEKYKLSYESLRNRPWPGDSYLLSKFDNSSAERNSGDQLFGELGVGILASGTNIYIDRPFERASAYISLLHILEQRNHLKYRNIHKGTPYYFLGMVFFQAYNFEDAMFFIDAAASEDLRLNDHASPAVSFFLLKENLQATGNADLHLPTINAFQRLINTFCVTHGIDFSVSNLSSKFVEKEFFQNKKFRSLVTALFRFVLESGRYEMNLKLRSSNGGSIEPFLNNLFFGARILESLLKCKYKGNTLEKLLSVAKKDLEVEINTHGNNKSFNSAISVYKEMKEKGFSNQNIYFHVSYIIRTLSSHSLMWEDSFTLKNYKTLKSCVENSILWTIYKLWIENSE